MTKTKYTTLIMGTFFYHILNCQDLFITPSTGSHSTIFWSDAALKRDEPSLLKHKERIFPVWPPFNCCTNSALLRLYRRIFPEAVPRAIISLPATPDLSSPFDLRFFFFWFTICKRINNCYSSHTTVRGTYTGTRQLYLPSTISIKITNNTLKFE